MRGRRARWRVLVAQWPGAAAGLALAAAVLWPLHPNGGPAVWLAWASAVPVALSTAAGERCGIHLVHGWRRLDPAVADQIRALCAAYRVDLERVDLYVARGITMVGAASTGRRTIAFEDSVLAAWRAGAVPDRSLVATAAHELAHLRHRDQRGALALFWLALPWTIVKAVVGAVAGRLLPRGVWFAGLVTILLVAVGREVLASHWVTVAVLALLIGQLLLGPSLARVGLARQERAADAEVWQVGLGPHLRTARDLVRAPERVPN